MTPSMRRSGAFPLIRIMIGRRVPVPRGLSPKTLAMLDAAYAFIHSVDYRVSLRWLFYRIMNVLGLAPLIVNT